MHMRNSAWQVGAIENEFRVFSMELLAGEARTDTEVVQHGTRFRLDFAQVGAPLCRPYGGREKGGYEHSANEEDVKYEGAET